MFRTAVFVLLILGVVFGHHYHDCQDHFCYKFYVAVTIFHNYKELTAPIVFFYGNRLLNTVQQISLQISIPLATFFQRNNFKIVQYCYDIAVLINLKPYEQFYHSTTLKNIFILASGLY